MFKGEKQKLVIKNSRVILGGGGSAKCTPSP